MSRPGREDLPVTVDSQLAFEGHIFGVRVDTIRFPDGRETVRDTVVHPGAVVVAALDDRERVVLVRQYRHATGERLLELPAGTLEPGEEPAVTAERELEEETGLAADRWERLGSFFSAPGFLTERLHAFLARDLLETAQRLEEDEDITLEWRPLQQLLADPCVLQDAKSLATLALVAAKLAEEGRETVRGEE